jgi:hypothetical protein
VTLKFLFKSFKKALFVARLLPTSPERSLSALLLAIGSPAVRSETLITELRIVAVLTVTFPKQKLLRVQKSYCYLSDLCRCFCLISLCREETT